MHEGAGIPLRPRPLAGLRQRTPPRLDRRRRREQRRAVGVGDLARHPRQHYYDPRILSSIGAPREKRFFGHCSTFW